MPGISDKGKIDLVGRSKEGNADLIIVDDGPWTGSAEQLNLLQDKLNSYINFFECGQLAEMYPVLKGKPVSICLMSSSNFDAKTQDFWVKAQKVLQARGVTLAFKTVK